MLEKAEADEFIKRHEDKFRHVLDDPNWVRVKDSQWLRYRVIDGVPVGVVVSLYQLQYAAYPINCEDLQRLLRGRLASKVDVIVIVFNEESTRSYRHRGSGRISRSKPRQQAHHLRQTRRFLVTHGVRGRG